MTRRRLLSTFLLLAGAAAYGSMPLVPGARLTQLEAAPPSTRPVEGLRDHTPTVHALTGARIVVTAGTVLEQGNVILRDGMIVAVGVVPVPADARVHDLTGKTIYPGLIDAFREVPVDAAVVTKGAAHWNDQVTPQLDVAEQYKPDSELNAKLRSQGVAAMLVAPAGRVLKGHSAVVLTGDDPVETAIRRRSVAEHLRLTVSRGRGEKNYPGSPMGAVALARQAFYDADWHARAWAAHRATPSLPQPEVNDALSALAAHRTSQGLFICDASNELFVLRADRFAREFSANLVIRGSGHEYKRLDAIAACGRAILVPVDFPKPPNVASAESAQNVELDDLLHWELAPENAARLVEAGVTIALTSHGLDDAGGFLAALRRAVKRGLPAEAALRALTTTPAALYGMADQLGSVEPRKLANLVITDGDLFDAKTKVLETWVNGTRYEIQRQPRTDLRGRWRLEIEGEAPLLEIVLQGSPRKLTGRIQPTGDDKAEAEEQDRGDAEEEKIEDESHAMDKKTDDAKKGEKQPPGKDAPGSALANVGFRDALFSCSFKASGLGEGLGDGIARLTAVVSAPADGEPSWDGHLTLSDGVRRGFTATRQADEPDGDTADGRTDIEAEDEADEEADAEADETRADGSDAKEASAANKSDEPAASLITYPLGAYGRTAAPEQPRAVLFTNGTIWTCDDEGILDEASVLVVNGTIQAVGNDLEAPEDALVVDLDGRHLTPGIIDCHSHMATDGGVNEGTQAITAEVRIGDFIDADDITIYRQLAGGVTAANILHGSANPIGGQNQVIKLRWSALPEEMKMAEAPQGIKFALGENVKQSNWGEEFTSRYPQTRMGVEQLMRDALQAARQYRKEQAEWQQTSRGLPPRYDLEQEAIAEIVEGSRWIHCHSYRQDEILALIRTLDDFGITIGSFQHILEGYKVADAMARHGATGSAFSDWWAYKFEVYDAIPYAGALMHDAGVIVSFNSDDQELARHLNHEAAKAVKYGGVSPEEALAFVTLNPAKQLRIDHLVGSLSPGKQADLVVWSGDPLSILARCEQTWIDGRRYFSIEEDAEARTEAEAVRNRLVQKILASGEKMESDEEKKAAESDLWPRHDIFCHGHDHESH